MDLEDTMSVKETAAYLHISTKTVYRWVDAGRLSAQKVGLQLFIKRDAVEALSAGRGVYIDNLVQRIDNLEQRLAELERTAQSSPQPHAAHPPPTTRNEQAKPSVAHSGAIAGLPEGMVAFVDFFKAHHISESTARRVLDQNQESAISGEWHSGGKTIKHVLDAAGCHVFYE